MSAIARRIMHEVDTHLWPHNSKLVSQLFFKRDPETWDQDIIEQGRSGVLDELARFEEMIDGDYLVGTLSAADFTLYPLLALHPRLEMRKADLGLTEALGPKLSAWKRRIEALPYFGKTVPPHWK